jgi:hypothetical protein
MKYYILLLLLCLVSQTNAQNQPFPPLHHPVGIPLAPNMQPPKNFILGQQNQLICATCHGIKKLNQIPLAEVNSKARNFLHNGPYPSLLDFCKNCHQSRLQQNTMQRFNLHKMLDSQGHLIKKNCTYCHYNIPNPVQNTDWNKLRFRLPIEKLCYGCHLKTPHLNALQHQQKPSSKVLKQMQRTEKQKHIILPLNKQGKITCITCHAPHQQGVLNPNSKAGRQIAQTSVEAGIQYGKANYWSHIFSEDKKQRYLALGYGQQGLKPPEYRPIQKEILLRLPAKNGELCQACHTFKD